MTQYVVRLHYGQDQANKSQVSIDRARVTPSKQANSGIPSLRCRGKSLRESIPLMLMGALSREAD